MQNNNFKILTWLLMVLITMNSCNQQNGSVSKDAIPNGKNVHDTIKNSHELDFLTKFNGKYPYDVKLLDNPVLKQRLQKIMGDQYEFLKTIWQVETPIETSDTFFYAWGMQAHSGGDPGAVLMANFHKNLLYVGIRKDKQVKIYAEDSSEVPKRMQNWTKEQ